MPEHSNEVVDDRWSDLADAQSVGEKLDAEELAFLRAHATDSPERAAEMTALAAMADLSRLGEPTREDAAIADAVIAELHDETRPGSHRSDAVVAFPRRAVAGVVVTTLAAAAALALWLRPAGDTPSPVLASTPDRAQTTSAPVLRSGALTHGALALAVGDLVPTGVWLTGTRDDSCIDAGVCADQGAQLQIDEGTHGRRLDLRQGRVRVDGHFGPLQVVTFQGTVASDGGRFTVEVDSEQVIVVVLVGPVTITDEQGRRELASGARLKLGETESVQVAPDTASAIPATTPGRPTVGDAADMLAKAQSLRGAGQHRRAAAAYQQLLTEYPDSSEAHAAAVTLGKLQLELGKPKAALGAFDRYLTRGGALVEEAAYGRVRALDRLGQDDRRDAAVAQFLADYPRSVYATEVDALRE